MTFRRKESDWRRARACVETGGGGAGAVGVDADGAVVVPVRVRTRCLLCGLVANSFIRFSFSVCIDCAWWRCLIELCRMKHVCYLVLKKIPWDFKIQVPTN